MDHEKIFLNSFFLEFDTGGKLHLSSIIFEYIFESWVQDGPIKPLTVCPNREKAPPRNTRNKKLYDKRDDIVGIILNINLNHEFKMD